MSPIGQSVWQRLTARDHRSIYQDIPLYSEEEFLEKAPESLHTEEALSNEHLLMLNRLNFELAERQRYSFCVALFCRSER